MSLVYKNLGVGLCADSNRERVAYSQIKLDEAACKSRCDADIACSGYTKYQSWCFNYYTSSLTVFTDWVSSHSTGNVAEIQGVDTLGQWNCWKKMTSAGIINLHVWLEGFSMFDLKALHFRCRAGFISPPYLFLSRVFRPLAFFFSRQGGEMVARKKNARGRNKGMAE